jgi:hypothetical protein
MMISNERPGSRPAPAERKANTALKLRRMQMALTHREPDRVPIGDFSGAVSSAAGAMSCNCRPTPIRIITTTSTGS